MRHLTSRQNGSRYYALGEAVIAKGQKVRLNELGLRFYVSNKGVPKRGHPKWDGRIGIVAKLTRDKTRARIIWDGNRTQSDALPIEFLEDASQPFRADD
jgi:hypothetical protein